MHAATIYDAGGDDKLMFFFHWPNNQRTKKGGLTFHHFPLTNPDLCKRWVVATKKEGVYAND